MQLRNNIAIPNTMQVHAQARVGCEAKSIGDVQEAVRYAQQQSLAFRVVGEGSNLLPAREVQAFVCLVRIKGVEVLRETEHEVLLSVCAGESWHAFVQYTLANSWYGLENLSLIPGSVGAAPVQNIGAYGVEVEQFIERVIVVDEHACVQEIKRDECQFAYRDSVFKQVPGHSIVAVQMRLSKLPSVVLDYPELAAYLRGAGVGSPSPHQVAQAVMAIRRQKLPDPAETPNAGSFFKNPVVPLEKARELSDSIAELRQFPSAEGIKLSAAQLIDRAGWKDKPHPRVRCWQTQPLVVVNQDHASLEEVLSFAQDIQTDILDKYGVQLELEPSLLS